MNVHCAPSFILLVKLILHMNYHREQGIDELDDQQSAITECNCKSYITCLIQSRSSTPCGLPYSLSAFRFSFLICFAINWECDHLCLVLVLIPHRWLQSFPIARIFWSCYWWIWTFIFCILSLTRGLVRSWECDGIGKICPSFQGAALFIFVFEWVSPYSFNMQKYPPPGQTYSTLPIPSTCLFVSIIISIFRYQDDYTFPLSFIISLFQTTNSHCADRTGSCGRHCSRPASLRVCSVFTCFLRLGAEEIIFKIPNRCHIFLSIQTFLDPSLLASWHSHGPHSVSLSSLSTRRISPHSWSLECNSTICRESMIPGWAVFQNQEKFCENYLIISTKLCTNIHSLVGTDTVNRVITELVRPKSSLCWAAWTASWRRCGWFGSEWDRWLEALLKCELDYSSVC